MSEDCCGICKYWNAHKCANPLSYKYGYDVRVSSICDLFELLIEVRIGNKDALMSHERRIQQNEAVDIVANCLHGILTSQLNSL